MEILLEAGQLLARKIGSKVGPPPDIFRLPDRSVFCWKIEVVPRFSCSNPLFILAVFSDVDDINPAISR
jgi:hypothetical protein